MTHKTLNRLIDEKKYNILSDIQIINKEIIGREPLSLGESERIKEIREKIDENKKIPRNSNIKTYREFKQELL